MASKTENSNGRAIVEVLTAHKGEILTLAEIAHEGGIKAETGYLAAARALAKEKGFAIEKIDNSVSVEVKTITTYPNGLSVEKAKTAQVAGYRLVELPKAE